MSEATRIGAVLAGYRVESLLGRGGMSVVYLAEHISLGRKVALKVLAPPLAHDPSFRERFMRESQRAAGLDHPNVIPIYDAARSTAATPTVCSTSRCGTSTGPTCARSSGGRGAWRRSHALHARAGRERTRRGPRQRPDPPRRQALEHPDRASPPSTST